MYDRTDVRHGHLQTSCAARLASDMTTSWVITSSVVKLLFPFTHVTTKRASCVVTLMAKGKLHTGTSDAGGGPVRHCAHRTTTLRSARGDVSITLTSVSSRITETARHTSARGQDGSTLPRRTLFHKKLVTWSVRGYPASILVIQHLSVWYGTEISDPSSLGAIAGDLPSCAGSVLISSTCFFIKSVRGMVISISSSVHRLTMAFFQPPASKNKVLIPAPVM